MIDATHRSPSRNARIAEPVEFSLIEHVGKPLLDLVRRLGAHIEMRRTAANEAFDRALP